MTTTGSSIQIVAPGTDSTVNWRLLSGNNRECGRGVGGYVDVAHCLDTIADLQAGLDRLAHRSRRADAYRWRWDLLQPDGTVLATSHTFDRFVRCEQGAHQFRASFGSAAVRPGLIVTGLRRRGSAA
jgi:hypothetical protein